MEDSPPSPPLYFGTLLQLRLKIYAFNLLNTEFKAPKTVKLILQIHLKSNTSFVF